MGEHPQRDPRASGAPRDGEGDLAGAFALLAEMTQDFADSLDLETTLERALSLIVAHLDAELGSLWLLEGDPETGRIVCRASVGSPSLAGLALPAGEGILGSCVRRNGCETVLDAAGDPSFAQRAVARSGIETRSLLCAPMSLGDDVLGAIEVVNKRCPSGRFTERDLRPLQVLTSSAALAIANARLTGAAIENERVRREIELAAEIQRGLLPRAGSQPVPVAGVNLPAQVVSGDFFDVVPLPGGEIAFCLGDVSGKGINAALLMAKTASVYRCLAKGGEGPGWLLARLDQEIHETATRGMFVTMVAGTLAPGSGRVRLANAGHEPPLLHRGGDRFEDVPAEAPPLGIAPGLPFPEQQLELRGGALYLCSDGLTEAPSGGDGGTLGRAGLRELVTRFAAKPLAERVEAIAAAARGDELRDDLTLLAAEGGSG